MRYAGEAYRWGLVIGHNLRPIAPGAGSCTFVHVGAPPAGATSGCTALMPAELRAILRLLRPEAHPVLIQAPAPIPAALAPRWGGPPATAATAAEASRGPRP